MIKNLRNKLKLADETLEIAFFLAPIPFFLW